MKHKQHTKLVNKLTREQNRRDFNLLAPFVDWARLAFPGSKPVYLEQDGKTIGVKPHD